MRATGRNSDDVGASVGLRQEARVELGARGHPRMRIAAGQQPTRSLRLRRSADSTDSSPPRGPPCRAQDPRRTTGGPEATGRERHRSRRPTAPRRMSAPRPRAERQEHHTCDGVRPPARTALGPFGGRPRRSEPPPVADARPPRSHCIGDHQTTQWPAPSYMMFRVCRGAQDGRGRRRQRKRERDRPTWAQSRRNSGR